jgi:hypothetical protein
VSTTIGEVNINLRLSTAQFKTDVRNGSSEARNATKKMKEDIADDTGEAKASLALLGEEFGIKIPRHIRAFITELPGVAPALDAAFNSVAVVALIGVIVEAAQKVKEFWESLGKLSAEEQALLDKATKGAKDALEYSTTLLKAEFDLQIAKAQGLDKDRLRVEEATALVGLNKNYADGLVTAKTHLEDLLKAQETMSEKYGKIVKDTTSPFGTIDLGALWNTASADKQAEGTKEKIEELTKTLGLANAALQTVQAGAINAGTTLSKDLSDGAKKSKEELDKISAAVFKLQSHLGVPETLQIKVNVDPQLFEVGAILEKLGQPRAPIYAGTKEAEELTKLTEDQAAAIAEAQKVYTQTRTSAENYAQEISKLNILLAEGRIDQDTYNRAVTEAKEKFDDNLKAVKEFGTDIGDTIKQSVLFGRSWSDTLKSVALDLAQLILKLTLFKSLSASAGASTGGGIGGFFGSLLSGLAGASGGGPKVGGVATGGPVNAGQMYQWQEHGKEYFVPASDGMVVPSGATKSAVSGKSTVNNFVFNGVTDMDSFRKSQGQLAADMFAMMATAARRNG